MTLTYEGDLEVKEKVDEIRREFMEKVTMKEVVAGPREEEEKFFRIVWLKGPNKGMFDLLKMKFIKKYLEKDKNILHLAHSDANVVTVGRESLKQIASFKCGQQR